MVGGSWSTRRELLEAPGEHANPTQKGPRLESNLGLSCCEVTAVTTATVTTVELTISLRHGVNKLAPLARHFGESPHSELVERAAVERDDVFGGLVPVVGVHPRVLSPLADRLVLYAVFNDASVGIFGGQPPQLDGRHGQRQGLDIPRGRRT